VTAYRFKYVAALLVADVGEHPRLIRIQSRAGHGGGNQSASMKASSLSLGQ